MSTPAALSAVLAVGFFTYFSRAGLILVLSQRILPESVQAVLRNVGPAVLSALVVTILAGDGGASDIEVSRLAGVAVASFVAWKTKNLILTLLAGMSVIWLSAFLF